ncbi:putative MFS family arabinose efflux permease [Actinomadura pelletieri DSM 43383]|uniref:Putative MFS family arabinose efflux permease n=1 Tax=Actinomadura pelletieri DSM 43383 TaxID=1120940 RepID=A0A495QQ79_9ACTN|nr:MFS transporter [Actinomadura pelletieri]RKS75117.1 putative MFS family arabinose efflux permease [Actinomadura pelletieri DSM 43383]
MLPRARWGTFLTFALAGLLTGVWVSRMPALVDKFELSEAEVGIVVLVWGLGAITAMQALRVVMSRAGSRATLRLALPLTALSYAAVALAPGHGALLAAVVVFGMTFGITDIAMNAQGTAVERAYKRPVMSGLHAGWSVGAMSGGLLGVVTAAVGLGFTETVLAAAALTLPAGLALGRTYLPDPPAAASAGTGRRARRMPLAVYLIGALCFIAFMTEGSIADWSGLLLHDEMDASEAVAAAGLPMFEAAMLTGRIFGDRVRAHVGTRRLLAGAGVGTALGMTVVVLSPVPALALAGFFVTGLMVCAVVPTTMSLAGTAAPDRPGAAVAQVSAIGYGGLLLGPVVVGFLSDATSLRLGVGTVVVLSLLIAAGARFVPVDGAADATPVDVTDPGPEPVAA